MNAKINIKKAIKLAIIKGGYSSVSAFCESAGFSYRTLASWFNNERSPSLSGLEQIADHLNIHVSELVAFGEGDLQTK